MKTGTASNTLVIKVDCDSDLNDIAKKIDTAYVNGFALIATVGSVLIFRKK